MKITKFGHSCFLVEEGEANILLDPGIYTEGYDNATAVNAVLVTHEHGDHYDPARLKAVLAANPAAKLYANEGVAAECREQGIACEVVAEGREFVVQGIAVKVYGNTHATIYPTLPPVANTGYFIAGRFFYPGDAFLKPEVPVEILALPLIAPWMRVAEAVDYAKALAPKIVIPAHDGILRKPEMVHFVPSQELPPLGIRFVAPGNGESVDL